MKKPISIVLIFLVLSVSCFAAFGAVIGGGGSSFGPPVWQTAGGVVGLIAPTSIINMTTNVVFISGNTSTNSVDIRSGNSLTFDQGQFTMSAGDFIFLTNGTRRQIQVDTDFLATNNLSQGTSYLSIINPSKTPLAKAAFALVNSDITGAILLKSNSLAVEPNVFEFQNNAGNFQMINGPMKLGVGMPFLGGEIMFGWYDNFTLDENLSIVSFNNKTFLMTLNQTKGVTIDGDLTIEGNFLFNEIFGELYFPENGDLNIEISSTFTYMNITNLTNGYSSSLTLDSSTIVIQQPGTYFTSFTGALIDGSSSDYGISVFVNGVEQNRTHAHFTTVTSGRYSNFAGQGTFSAVEGDIINLRVQDEDNPASDADFNNINFIVRRIGS